MVKAQQQQVSHKIFFWHI